MERLKELRKAVNNSLVDNIPPSLTLDICTSAANVSYLSYTMHMPTKEFMMQTYAMGALPLYDLSYDKDIISDIWLCMCADTLDINDNRM